MNRGDLKDVHPGGQFNDVTCILCSCVSKSLGFRSREHNWIELKKPRRMEHISADRKMHNKSRNKTEIGFHWHAKFYD